MMKKRLASMTALSVLSVLTLIAVLSPPAATQTPPSKVAGAPKELRVGIVTLLSGPASSTFGIPAKKAADAWVEKINDEGGIGGAKLVPVLTDEAGPGDKVVAEFRRLAADEKVDLVIGYISSANCVAVPAVAEELRVLTVLFDCGTTRVFEEAKYKYVFRTAAHTGIDGICARGSWWGSAARTGPRCPTPARIRSRRSSSSAARRSSGSRVGRPTGAITWSRPSRG